MDRFVTHHLQQYACDFIARMNRLISESIHIQNVVANQTFSEEGGKEDICAPVSKGKLWLLGGFAAEVPLP
jgi:hypothetical protein